MIPRIQKESFSLFTPILTVALIFMGALCVRAQSTGNILIRENFNSKNRIRLIEKLRAISGLRELSFDGSGVLRSGSQKNGGSAAARNLILGAISGPHVIVFEEVNDSTEIVFSRVIPAMCTSNTNRPAFVIQIDFSDFDQLMGDRQAKQAFDVSWAVLHELDHVVNDSYDSNTFEQVGECESNINAMRRELNLPERAAYFHELLPHTSTQKARFVRLAFRQRDARTNKERRFWLLWDATVVGGLRDTGQLASIQ